VCGGATDGSNSGSAPGSPNRSGAKRIGAQDPNCQTNDDWSLDADVVVEPLTDGSLSESIRNALLGRDE
jgi:hypothetical protein